MTSQIENVCQSKPFLLDMIVRACFLQNPNRKVLSNGQPPPALNGCQSLHSPPWSVSNHVSFLCYWKKKRMTQGFQEHTVWLSFLSSSFRRHTARHVLFTVLREESMLPGNTIVRHVDSEWMWSLQKKKKKKREQESHASYLFMLKQMMRRISSR